jgi:hypothetical protein
MKTGGISCTPSVGEAGKCKGESSAVRWAAGLSEKTVMCLLNYSTPHIYSEKISHSVLGRPQISRIF